MLPSGTWLESGRKVDATTNGARSSRMGFFEDGTVVIDPVTRRDDPSIDYPASFRKMYEIGLFLVYSGVGSIPSMTMPSITNSLLITKSLFITLCSSDERLPARLGAALLARRTLRVLVLLALTLFVLVLLVLRVLWELRVL